MNGMHSMHRTTERNKGIEPAGSTPGLENMLQSQAQAILRDHKVPLMSRNLIIKLLRTQHVMTEPERPSWMQKPKHAATQAVYVGCNTTEVMIGVECPSPRSLL